MEPAILTFFILFGGTYSVSSLYLKKDEQMHQVKTLRRIIE